MTYYRIPNYIETEIIYDDEPIFALSDKMIADVVSTCSKWRPESSIEPVAFQRPTIFFHHREDGVFVQEKRRVAYEFKDDTARPTVAYFIDDRLNEVRRHNEYIAPYEQALVDRWKMPVNWFESYAGFDRFERYPHDLYYVLEPTKSYDWLRSEFNWISKFPTDGKYTLRFGAVSEEVECIYLELQRDTLAIDTSGNVTGLVIRPGINPYTGNYDKISEE